MTHRAPGRPVPRRLVGAPVRGRRHRTPAAPISSSCWRGAWKGRAISPAPRPRSSAPPRSTARSSEVRAELGAFHLRRSQPEEAETAAKAALAIDSTSLEGHRVLGLVYAGYADGGSQRGVRRRRSRSILKDAITHLELASASTLAGDLVLNFTLGRLYLRAGTPEKAVQSLTRVVAQNPGSVQARLLLAQAHAVTKDVPAAIATLEAIVDEEPRVAAALGPVPGAGRAAARGRRHLHQGARRAADEPRAEVAAHHRALQRQGLQGGGGVRHRRAPAASGGRAFPPAAGPRAVRRRRPRRRRGGAGGSGEGVSQGHADAVCAGRHLS